MNRSDDALSAFWARPDQTLGDHLEGVADGCELLVEAGSTMPTGNSWTQFLKTVAWTHDVGKLTDYFQTYIKTGDRSAAPTPELTYHSFTGSVVTAAALARQGFDKKATAAGFYAVLRHHSVIENVPSDLPSYYESRSAVDARYELVERQVRNIDQNAAQAADEVLTRATGGQYGWEGFQSDGVEFVRQLVRATEAATSESDFYEIVLRAWSTLVAADKFDASGLATGTADRLSAAPRPPAGRLSNYIRGLSDTELPDGNTATQYLDAPQQPIPGGGATIEQRLAAVRTKANEQAVRNLQARHEAGERVFELTLPTGFGKTYTGLRSALSLAEIRDSRVIYALPYTSIIDQVDSEIQRIFDVSPRDPEYTVHHHLADTLTVSPAGGGALSDGIGSGADTLHAEAWRSGLVLTTFTQLFESVAGPQNTQSMKLPALQNSIIILDEPQALSLEWWQLVGRLTEFLTDEYDATVVFMTATQPRILDNLPDYTNPTPLIDCLPECNALLRDSPRVRFQIHDSLKTHLAGAADPLPLPEAATEIEDSATKGDNTLAIVNTVESAVTLTKHLLGDDTAPLAADLLDTHDSNPDPFDPDAYLKRFAERHTDAEQIVAALTTRLRPVDRSRLIDVLDHILDPETTTPIDGTPLITVSTQLIEAGVDVSFDRLYRDYAPIPSIVQAAGRCNREFGGNAASVTVWRLDSPTGSHYVPSELIYGNRSLLHPTQQALSRVTTRDYSVPEVEMITAGVETYYQTLHGKRKTGHRGDRLVSAFDGAKGEKLRNASLVGSEYPTQETIVLTSETDREQARRYQQYNAAEEWSAAQAAFQDLKHLLVTLPVEEPVDELKIIDATDTDSYHPETGGGPSISETQTHAEL